MKLSSGGERLRYVVRQEVQSPRPRKRGSVWIVALRIDIAIKGVFGLVVDEDLDFGMSPPNGVNLLFADVTIVCSEMQA